MINDYQQLLLLAMASDPRLPRSALLYISDVGSAYCHEKIRNERLNQLNNYVPDLVAKYRELTEKEVKNG